MHGNAVSDPPWVVVEHFEGLGPGPDLRMVGVLQRFLALISLCLRNVLAKAVLAATAVLAAKEVPASPANQLCRWSFVQHD